MRIVIALAMLLLLPMVAGAFGIVNNVGTTPEDSVSFIILNPDSLGQPLGGLDSTKVLVLGPTGDSVFTETVTGVAGRVGVRSTGAGKYDTVYYYKALVADIDGSGVPGTYSIRLMAVSNATGAWLRFSKTYEFQLTGSDLSDALFAIHDDSLGLSAGAIYNAAFAALDTFSTDSCAPYDTLVRHVAERVLDFVFDADSAGTLLRPGTFANGLKRFIVDSGGSTLTIEAADIEDIADALLHRPMTTYKDSTATWLGHWLFRTVNPDSIATTSDIALAVVDQDTTGHGAAGTFGKAIISGGGGTGSLDIAELSNWADTAKIMKYWMPTKQVLFGGFHVEGQSTDTFPGAFSVRHSSSINLPGMYSRGGGLGTGGHGAQFLGGSSGGDGVNIAATGGSSDGIDATGYNVGHGVRATGGNGLLGTGILAYSGLGVSGYGIRAVSQATNGIGVSAEGTGTADGFNVSASGTGDAFQADGYRDFVIGTGTGYIDGALRRVDTVLITYLNETDLNGHRYAIMPEGWNVDDSTAHSGTFGAISTFTGEALAKVDSIAKNGAAWTPTSITGSFIGNITGNLSGSVGSVTSLGTVNANITQVSGSSATADNLEAAFDGSSLTRGTAHFSYLEVSGSNAGTGSLVINNSSGTLGSPAILATAMEGEGLTLYTNSSNYPALSLFTDYTYSISATPADVNLIVDSVVNSGGGSGGGMSYTEFTDYITDHPELFGCVSASVPAAYTLAITVLDTSATPTDDSLQGLIVTVLNQAGNPVRLPISGSGGRAYCDVDTGTYILKSGAVAYVFDSSVINVTGNTSTVFRGRKLLSNPLYTIAFIKVRGNEFGIGPAKGLRLEVVNGNTATYSGTGETFAPYRVKAWTDDSGYAAVQIPRSFVYGDSLKGCVNAYLMKGGLELAKWELYYIPDQDTVRFSVR